MLGAIRWVYPVAFGVALVAAIGSLFWLALVTQYDKGYRAGIAFEQQRQREAARKLGEQTDDKKLEFDNCLAGGWMWDFAAGACTNRPASGAGDSGD